MTCLREKVLHSKEAEIFFKTPIIIEEKVDGANLGISITENYELMFQNRSHYVNSSTSTQWRNLDEWVQNHPGIWQILTSPDMILFGEWCYAKHSIHYTQLKDYFLAFDIYDKREEKFLSRECRDKLLEGSGIESVPLIGKGVFDKDQVLDMLQQSSQFYDGPVEGLYLRIEENGYEVKRGKVVRPDFIQDMEDHWSKKTVVKNKIIL